MIRREIERRHREGTPPDEQEAALVNFAMQLDADAADDSTERDAAAGSGAPREPAEGSDIRTSHVAFTAAFLTGHPLTVRLKEYQGLQRELGAVLKGPRWRVEGMHPRGGTYTGPWGGGFTESLPLVLARREGADWLPRLSARLQGELMKPASAHNGTSVLDANAKDLVIDVYDLGVAVITAWVELKTAPDTDLGAMAREVKQMAWLRPRGLERSPLADELEILALETAREYSDATAALPHNMRQTAWLTLAERGRTNSGAHRWPDELGHLLWLHPVHLFRTDTRAEEIANELAPAFRETIKFEDGYFAAGIGSSAIVVSPQSVSANTPLRLTQLHWAYYALYMEIDRGLLFVLNQERWAATAPLRQLENEAEDVFSDYLRIMDARARLDSHLSAVGGDDYAIWERIASVQRFSALENSVERKLRGLKEIAKRRVDQATADRAHRSGYILSFLTALTIVTVTAILIGVFVGARDEVMPELGWRPWIIAAAIVVAIFLWWLAIIRTARTTPPFRRHRGRS